MMKAIKDKLFFLSGVIVFGVVGIPYAIIHLVDWTIRKVEK